MDPQSRNSILESVESLSAEGMAVLYTTHYMEEAERLCDRVAIIDEGVVRAEGTRRELVSLVGEKTGSGSLPAATSSGLPRQRSKCHGVSEASPSEECVEILADDASTILPDLLGRVAGAGAVITGVEVIEPNLEAVFLAGHRKSAAGLVDGTKVGAATRIATKDLKLRIRDKSAFILGILAPLVLAFIFNFVFGSGARRRTSTFNTGWSTRTTPRSQRLSVRSSPSCRPRSC